MVDDAKKSCEKEVDRLREKYREEGILLEQSTKKNMDRAVDFIVERIVTQYGNS
jgi:N-acetylglutamate synthase-like GNAT family acetyltransferase